ncbi:MAG TPA: ABC transporter ATP-binding protein [Thermoleophilaceae bacterium]|nr:ABC transporter ATP-binding protein [Thermoleophilaceae bacterium]
MPGDRPGGAALSATGLSKTFRIPREQVHTLKERALHPLRRGSHHELRALDDVSFEVEPGEFFGVVGRNGSGKSTLMKCVAGIYRPDAGEIWARGRMATFIELGVGFNPDLAAHDNVMINAIMLGLSPAEARRRYEAIVRFAELEEFADLKLKNYSSGMHVRLAFSVMAHVDADLLLIDEVLAVGDASFQQKCHDALQELRGRGKTIVLVTHDMNAVQRFCDRAMVLERGKVVGIGDPRSVARRYQELNFGGAADAALSGAHLGDGAASILDIWFEDGDGRRAEAMPHASDCGLFMRVEFNQRVEDPTFGVMVTDEKHRPVWAATSGLAVRRSGGFDAGERVDVGFRFSNVLAPGRYFASPEVVYYGGGHRLMDHREDAATMVVTGVREAPGMVDLPVEVTITSSNAPVEQAAGR